MPLSANQKRHLRGLAHPLAAIIMVGQKGLTDAVLKEFDSALDHHELVKVKIAADDRTQRAALIDRLREVSKSEVVQQVGHIACFYRHNPDRAIITLPK